MTNTMTATAALDRLETLYAQSVASLRDAVKTFLATGERPDIDERNNGLFAYPELRVSWFGDRPQGLPIRAWARLSRPGVYSTTITRPELYRSYLQEQLTLLEQDYGATFDVGPSEQEIPFPYVLDGSDVVLDATMTASIARYFPTTDLAHIGDEISDGLWDAEDEFPLAQFDGLRTDFSLARLRHYTGTPVEDVQNYILFTNYNRYVDEFVRWALEQIKDPNSIYETFSTSGGVVVTRDTPNPEAVVADAAWKKHQMPAYHLTAPGWNGITLVNIGVGPSNAKTICDHLAVTRPHAWMMIGHCGGLRPSQTIGDYVLAHAYLREDHVLDAVLPPDIPIPSIAEVQRALY
ncbi:MAG: AMP nucleosidase, partial [Brevundimonas sp.]|nr:AMP nucleosidase [Brevundimonas sp.]